MQRRKHPPAAARRGAVPAPRPVARPGHHTRQGNLPFIRAATVAGALEKVRSGEYDSAFSAEKIQTFAWFGGKPLNYSLDDIPRTQTIEPVYVETSAFFIFSRELWCGRGRRIGDRPYMAVVDHIEGLDIDYPEDFTMAEIIAASRNLQP